MSQTLKCLDFSDLPLDPSVWLLGLQLSTNTSRSFAEYVQFLETQPGQNRGFFAGFIETPSSLRLISEIQDVPSSIGRAYGHHEIQWTSWCSIDPTMAPPWASPYHKSYPVWVATLAHALKADSDYQYVFATYARRGVFYHRLLADVITAKRTPTCLIPPIKGIPAFSFVVVKNEEFLARESEQTYKRFRDYEAARLARKIRRKMNSGTSIMGLIPTLASEPQLGKFVGRTSVTKLPIALRVLTKKSRRLFLRILYLISIRVRRFVKNLARIVERFR